MKITIKILFYYFLTLYMPMLFSVKIMTFQSLPKQSHTPVTKALSLEVILRVNQLIQAKPLP